ncbi:period circadian protein isoform X7 [Spodoptera frugiperda]|uniref:Period circadian protein n=1 Tax=Spodoptera frugiperda TaxID=7108 RepID=A0A9R0EEM4_SPOFR|nr:period circadian protein isoform X7 [Spodoptera frugiperda]
MDNLDDSENNAKISDSAYSNSCSNSQSRRSHSSKSTHSGSNSSGSSGYGGKPSTSGSSNNLGQPPKKDKEPKKKKPQIETMVPDVVVETEARAPEPVPTFDAPKEDQLDVIPSLPPAHAQSEKGVENMDICTPELNTLKDEVVSCNISQVNPGSSFVTGRPLQATYCAVQSKRYQEIGRFEMRCESSEQLRCKDGFSCVISMHDGVVMYATSSLTTTLGFPKDMWIGRSFIDFVHPRDRNTFASQITNGLAVPKIVNGTQEKVQSPANSVSTMVCRIRRYRGLTTGFGVKERVVGFMPFLLKLTFKNISDEEGKVIYLVIQATPFFSAFKTPNEVVVKAVPFVIRHAANGHIEYVDPESVPYLGYLPQDLADKDALMLYHPDDLMYLRQVYDTIVKEGGLPRSKAYRMITQNGDYIRLETEWSSFINPWSKKLEFVIGKHHILEGPTNPDVFQSPEPEKSMKIPEEEKNKAQMLRETIIRTMNEALTKPAEIAKQQMSKRCQDLASFMESLMEEVPKTDEELRLEIHDPDHSYYERDSVMLGGISPHHDYYDSKSSTETPLSYNQLNYNETLQRYFDSHQPISYEDYNTVTGENILGLKDPRPIINHCLSPMAQHSGDSGEMTCSSDSNGMVMGSNSPVMPLGDYQPIRLTEALLSKSFKFNRHNADMEKELMKMHRETRSSSKGEREKNSNETRKKKKEHLARCNASYHPTSAGATNTEHQQPHGVKRTSKMMDADAGAHKHHCPSPRQARRNKRTLSTNAAVAQPSTSITTTTVGQLATASNHWPTPPANNMNTFILGVGIPQQMSIMSPMPHPMQAMHTMPAVPGMFPMYYAPAAAPQPMPTSSGHHHIPSSSQHQFPAPMMMYSQPMYGAPFMYSPMAQQMSYPMQQSHMMAQSMQQYTNTMNPLGLTSSNYEEACKPSLTLRPSKVQGGVWRDKKRAESQGTSSKTDNGSADSNSSTNALNRVSGTHKSQSGNEKSTIYSTDIRSSNSMSAKPNLVTRSSRQDWPRLGLIPQSTEAVPNTPPSARESRLSKLNRLGNSEETPDKTDGESSYSSFYSSFFKTESGSAEDSGDGKNGKDKQARSPLNLTSSYHLSHPTKKVARRKMEPPWLEQVCVTSELVYKYQILTKSMEETLSSDKQKMKTLEQPSLVNEQLSQLYLDLQLEGAAARLTLEEGITSSSSSGEETTTVTKTSRRKREYSKLVMIYEEDAPLPPPPEDAVEGGEASSSSTC